MDRTTAYLISCSDHYNHRFLAASEQLRELGYRTIYITSDFDHTTKAPFACQVPGCVQLHALPYKKNLSVARIMSHFFFARDLFRYLENLPEEHRKKVCIIYFDNEEKGLLGSAFFYQKHRKQIKDKILINFDCVGDGENIVTMADGRSRKDELYPLFVDSLKKHETGANVNYLCRKMKWMMFASDQANFRKGIGVCALKKSPIGYYVARIHTYFDTNCRQENVEYLTKAMTDFITELPF